MSMNVLAYFDGHMGTESHAYESTHTLAEASDRDSMHRTTLPSRQLNALRTFVAEEWDAFTGKYGPTFLWDDHIEEAATHNDRMLIEDTPVAPAAEAHAVMTKPIEWYFASLASVIPTAQRTSRGIQIPNADMPTYYDDSRALAGVESVVANAVRSDHWLEATENLADALNLTAMFLSNAADRENEGFSFITRLTQQIRVYFDSLSRNADPSTAGKALKTLVGKLCNENFMLNPIQMVEALSCVLSFARWDDTRILAYEAVSTVDAAVERFIRSLQTGHADASADERYPDTLSTLIGNNQAAELRDRYNRLMLFLRHDLLRLAGDADAANRFLDEHSDLDPFADVLASQLIHDERWSDLLRFCDTILETNPNHPLTLFNTDVTPYGWDSLREAALESIGNRSELQAMYRGRIVEAYDSDEAYNVANLRAVSPDDWPNQIRQVVEAYADGMDRFTRNKAYERLLIDEGLSEEAYRYCRQFPKAQDELAKTIASAHPDAARSIILGPVGLDGSYQGELPTQREAYRTIARSLTRYASVFTVAEAQEIASRLVERYPARHQLAQALHAFLE